MGQSTRLDEVSVAAARNRHHLPSGARRLFASISAVLPLVFVACSGSVAGGGGVDAAQEAEGSDAKDAGELVDSTDLWDGLMPCNGAGCDAGPHNGDAGLCTTDGDCLNGYVCTYRIEKVCSLTKGEGRYPNTVNCTGGPTACDCSGATFEIPCQYYNDGISPQPVAYFGACEAGPDDGGDASPE